MERADLEALLAGAAVFCYPSLKEGFGLPVLEAMAQGTPVVTSKDTSMAEVAIDASVLVDPRDEDAIAAAMDELLTDDGTAARLADAGRARAALYTWERTAAVTKAVYDEAVGR